MNKTLVPALYDHINTRHGDYAIITELMMDCENYKTSVYPLNKSSNPIYKKPLKQYGKIYNDESITGKVHIDTIIALDNARRLSNGIPNSRT